MCIVIFVQTYIYMCILFGAACHLVDQHQELKMMLLMLQLLRYRYKYNSVHQHGLIVYILGIPKKKRGLSTESAALSVENAATESTILRFYGHASVQCTYGITQPQLQCTRQPRTGRRSRAEERTPGFSRLRMHEIFPEMLIFFRAWNTHSRVILAFFCVMATCSDKDDEFSSALVLRIIYTDEGYSQCVEAMDK